MTTGVSWSSPRPRGFETGDSLPDRPALEEQQNERLDVARAAAQALPLPGTGQLSRIPAVRAALARHMQGIATTANRRIFAASVVIGAAIVGVKLVAMLKDLVVAATFGASNAIDVYLMAFVLPSFAINLIAGSFHASLIPTYIETREQQGKTRADAMLGSTMLISVCLLGVVAVLLALVGPRLLPLLASGFDPEKLALTQQLFYFMLPCVVFSGIATLWSAVLNADERFALVELSQVAVPVCSAAAILIGAQRWGIYALTVGFVAGFFFQACIIAGGMRRSGVSVVPRWHGRDAATMRVIGQYLPMLAGGLLLGMHPLIDHAMAATLGPGSVAVLGYGNKVVALVMTLGATAIGTAVLPHFSRMIAAGDIAGVRHTLKTFGGLIVAATVPITLLLVFLSTDIVRVIFERGAFTTTDTVLVASVQAMATLQIPFYVLGILLVRLLSSMKANHILMAGTAISFVINIILDYVLKELMGVAGIALATSIVYACSLAFLAVMLHRRLARMEPGALLTSTADRPPAGRAATKEGAAGR